MARVTTVERARKAPGRCGKCGDEIGVGDAYSHASPGFRGPKLVRCSKPACRFRPSDLTTSNMAEVYAAQEVAHDDLDGLGDDWETVDDVQQILQTCADEARGVAEQYTEAADAMGAAGEEHQEKADAIESWCDDLENTTFDDPPTPDEDADDDAVADEWDSWREGVLDAAREAIDNLEV